MTVVAGRRCSSTIESQTDEVVTTGYSKAILDKILHEFQSPEKAESRLAEVLCGRKSWPPADVYPMSSLYQHLADSYNTKRQSHKEMRYMLHVFLLLIQLSIPVASIRLVCVISFSWQWPLRANERIERIRQKLRPRPA